MDKQEISLLKSKFDELAHVDESGVEYWSAREIMTLFGYNRWENFYNAITKALTSIQNAQIANSDKPVGGRKNAPMSGAQR